MPKLYLPGPLFCQNTSIQLSDVFGIYFLVNLKDKEKRTSLPQCCIIAHDYIFISWKPKQGCISHMVHLSTSQMLNLLGWKLSPMCTNPFLQQMHSPVWHYLLCHSLLQSSSGANSPPGQTAPPLWCALVLDAWAGQGESVIVWMVYVLLISVQEMCLGHLMMKAPAALLCCIHSRHEI